MCDINKVLVERNYVQYRKRLICNKIANEVKYASLLFAGVIFKNKTWLRDIAGETRWRWLTYCFILMLAYLCLLHVSYHSACAYIMLGHMCEPGFMNEIREVHSRLIYQVELSII